MFEWVLIVCGFVCLQIRVVERMLFLSDETMKIALLDQGLLLGALCPPASPVFPRYAGIPVNDEGDGVCGGVSVVLPNARHHNIMMFR